MRSARCPILLLITIMVIYMVLAILYEHYAHPLTILTALPFAGFGALLMLLLSGMELNIFSFVGIILLVGLVKKNGIMMVDFALQLQREKGLPAQEAIVEACLIRFRPIMMTTLAAICATLAAGPGYRHRLRNAPAAGHRRGRRAGVLPDADALRDADVLRQHGAVDRVFPAPACVEQSAR